MSFSVIDAAAGRSSFRIDWILGEPASASRRRDRSGDGSLLRVGRGALLLGVLAGFLILAALVGIWQLGLRKCDLELICGDFGGARLLVPGRALAVVHVCWSRV